MQRIYDNVLKEHFARYEQMAFLCGPRQVGKTTIATNCTHLTSHHKYLNWDEADDRIIMLEGSKKIIEGLPIDLASLNRPLLILDEIHKYSRWKNLLKGLIDKHKGELNILVTGSAKLNVYRHGGDSLMGRYFIYRAHPLSIGELLRLELPKHEYVMPKEIDIEQLKSLYKFGGFPEPFLKQDIRFYNRWQNLRSQQVVYDDIRNFAQIQELAQLEILAELLKHQSSHTLVYKELSKKIKISETTVKRWIDVLETFYYCFTIRPWTKNVSRSLLKEPKVYLWDWSVANDNGAKLENFVACHLLKAVHYWTDLGFGKYKLHFLRDKDKKEVDFLISKNNQPWILLEVKSSGREALSGSLFHFQSQVQAKHVLQVAFDLPYLDIDCFSLQKPTIVPLITFLSQLI